MTAEVETISTSISKKIVFGTLILVFISTASAEFYYSDTGVSISGTDSYFQFPEYESQQEIATKLVAPFIFVTVLLHFALSRALGFILATGDEPWEDHSVWSIPYTVPMRERPGMGHHSPDVSKYAMIMSLTITASLIPTPYWDIISNMMRFLGLGLTVAFVAAIGFVVYLMGKMT